MNHATALTPPSISAAKLHTATESRFDRIHDGLQALARKMDELESKLAPVLDTSPKPSAVGNHEAYASNSPLASKLGDVEGILASLNERLGTTIGQIDL